jgi:hypothetical protein
VRNAFCLLATLILAGAAATAGAHGQARSAAVSPRLLLVDADVAMLRGVGFKPAERVRVEIDAGNRDLTRRATASQSGAFTMRLAGVDANECEGFAARAIGDKGSRATFKRARGQCALP